MVHRSSCALSSSKKIPADDTDRSIVFPFLAREETSPGSGLFKYHFALLVSDRNHFARALLEKRLGFVGDDETVPDGMGLDETWSFFRCRDDGPLKTLSEEAGAEHPFATYLALEFPAGSTFRPSKITVADSTLNATEFNREFFLPDSSPWFVGLPLLAGDAGAKFSWAVADNTEDTALSFLFVAKGEVPSAGGNTLEVNFKVSFERRADGATWSGGVLKLNAVAGDASSGQIIVGNPGNRLITDDGILVSRMDADGNISVHYEFLPTEAVRLPIGGSGL